MVAVRLDSEERRRAIVEAAMPLFARRGFARTTTKEIAEAAGVSEALLFKHFATKAALYGEILSQGCRRGIDPALAALQAAEPSTATLVRMVEVMVRLMVLGLPEDEEREIRHRLMVTSLLEDGEFARIVLENVFGWVYPTFAACLRAAAAAGDLATGPGAPENKFWFGHHVAAFLAYARLPGRETVPYAGPLEAVVADAVRFVLRGIGLTERAIATHMDPAAAACGRCCAAPAGFDTES
ncbi:MAG: helix-turn-helix domain-containing protein [Dongiaceae bacterium]